MENSNKIVPPHLNAEVYRTDTTGTHTLPNLDYIHLHTDGSILIGCSELTGRYWNGGSSIFKSVTEAQKFQRETKKSIYLSSGTGDGCFVDSPFKVLLCEDSGAVSVWSTKDDAWKLWNQDVSVTEHDGMALAVACLDTGKNYVTVGSDGNAKVWDTSEMICIRNYVAAHSMAIYGVSVRPNSVTSFATGSSDQYVSLWSDNTEQPILELEKNDCGIRCLQWLDENRLVFGDEAGILRLVDVRKHDTITLLNKFPAAIHRITVQPESSKIAVCCDNKLVSVCEITEENKSKLVYRNGDMHSDYVRGLAWDPLDKNILYSSGWDGEINTHNIQQLRDLKQ